jgi:hypothetical protein
MPGAGGLVLLVLALLFLTGLFFMPYTSLKQVYTQTLSGSSRKDLPNISFQERYLRPAVDLGLQYG